MCVYVHVYMHERMESRPCGGFAFFFTVLLPNRSSQAFVEHSYQSLPHYDARIGLSYLFSFLLIHILHKCIV